MRPALGEVKRVLKIFVFFVFLPLFLAPSCKPHDSNSRSALDLSVPTGFAATTVSTTQIDLAWTNVAADATGIEIERSVDGGAFAPLASLAPTATGYSDMALTPSTQYSYRIRAVNGSSAGAWLVLQATTILVAALTATPDPVDGAPDERMWHSMIYDPVDDQILIFGGLTGSGPTDELWKLAFPGGVPTWSLVGSGTVPGPRFGHCAVLDSTYHRMIVHGGTLGGVGGDYDDVFQLDLTTYVWSVLPLNTVQFPFGRHGHSAIYDPPNSRMLMYGGNDDVGSVEEVWELTLPDPSLAVPANSGVWTDVTPPVSGPGPRSDHTAVYDAAGTRMIVYGGRDATPPPGSPSPDLWALDLTGLTWSSLTPTTTVPPARYGHSGILNGTRMMVFGGDVGTADANFWQLNLGAPDWFGVALGTPRPGARLGHSAVRRGSTMILFGGGSSPSVPSFLDLWKFDL